MTIATVVLNFVQSGTPNSLSVTRKMQSVPREGDTVSMTDNDYGVAKDIFWQVSGVPIVRVVVHADPTAVNK